MASAKLVICLHLSLRTFNLKNFQKKLNLCSYFCCNGELLCSELKFKQQSWAPKILQIFFKKCWAAWTSHTSSKKSWRRWQTMGANQIFKDMLTAFYLHRQTISQIFSETLEILYFHARKLIFGTPKKLFRLECLNPSKTLSPTAEL